MVNDLFVKIIADAIQGKQRNLEVRLNQLIYKIGDDSPELIKKLNSILSHSSKSSSLRSEKDLINKIKPLDSDSRQELLKEEYPVFLEDEPVMASDVTRLFERFIHERYKSNELAQHGLLPSKSILLSGPPGVGKTMSAHWIARELDLPLLTLDLATVMSSYLGKTGNNIRSVLDYAKQFPCVLLLDEFDSIAKKRDDEGDVGELKRLVTVLLQAIDNWPHTSVLIAATNHAELLDPAVWRRFDRVVDFKLPDSELIEKFLQKYEINEKVIQYLIPSFEGLSFALIERIIKQSKINSILEDITLSCALADELGLTKNKNDMIMKFAGSGISQRQIALELDVPRSTVRKIINQNA